MKWHLSGVTRTRYLLPFRAGLLLLNKHLVRSIRATCGREHFKFVLIFNLQTCRLSISVSVLEMHNDGARISSLLGMGEGRNTSSPKNACVGG